MTIRIIQISVGLKWERTGEGKFLVGYKEGDAEFGKVGKIGGKRNITITKANIPSYNLTVTDEGHSHRIPYHGDYAGIEGVGRGTVDGSYWHMSVERSQSNIKVHSGGSGTSIDITPVYEVKAFWTRVS